MKERDLGTHLQCWLEQQNWEVYPEAQIRHKGPRADAIAVKGSLCWVIEIKKNLTLALLEQALKWRDSGASLVSVCVPYIARRKAGKHCWHSRVVDDILRHYGLGLLFLKDTEVLQAIQPRLFRYNYKRSQHIIAHLDQRMRAYCPGNTSQDGYSKPSQRVLEDCLQFISHSPGCSLSHLAIAIKTPFHKTIRIKKYLLRLLCQASQVTIQQERFEYFFSISDNKYVYPQVENSKIV